MIAEAIGFLVFVGIVLAFSKYALGRDIAGWIWERVRDGWDRIGR